MRKETGTIGDVSSKEALGKLVRGAMGERDFDCRGGKENETKALKGKAFGSPNENRENKQSYKMVDFRTKRGKVHVTSKKGGKKK